MKANTARTGFSELRLQTLSRTPGFRAGAPARDRLEQLWDRAHALGGHHALLPGQAQLLVFYDPRVWYGEALTIGLLDRVPGDSEALAFLAEALTSLVPPGDCLFEVPANDPELLAVVLDRGLAIDSVILVGDPREARARLRAPALPDTLAAAPLEGRDVAEVIALHARVFGAHPERCWFGARPSHLAGLAASLRADPAGQLIVRERSTSRLVGHAGASLERNNPYWGEVAGLELVLDDALVGRGLARPLYRLLLDHLLEVGCDVMKGGTNQPGVLHLGRVMGRPWHAFNLRPRGFPLDHFLPFAPPPVAAALERARGRGTVTR